MFRELGCGIILREYIGGCVLYGLGKSGLRFESEVSELWMRGFGNKRMVLRLWFVVYFVEG